MCCMGMQMHGVMFTFIHTVMLLVASFFVLVVARKNDSQGLKVFGYIIAALLLLSAALSLGKGLVGRKCMMNKMPGMADMSRCQKDQPANTQAVIK